MLRLSRVRKGYVSDQNGADSRACRLLLTILNPSPVVSLPLLSPFYFLLTATPRVLEMSCSSVDTAVPTALGYTCFFSLSALLV